MLRKLAITIWKKCSALEAFGSEESVLSDYLYIAKHSGVLNLTCRDLALAALLDAHLLPVPLHWSVKLQSNQQELLMACCLKREFVTLQTWDVRS